MDRCSGGVATFYKVKLYQCIQALNNVETNAMWVIMKEDEGKQEKIRIGTYCNPPRGLRYEIPPPNGGQGFRN